MTVQIVYGDHDLVLPLALDAMAEERLAELMGEYEPNDPIRAALARSITDAICALLNCPINPPSEKQVKYAIAIARELSLAVPPEVLQSREAMGRFLTAHAQTYRRRRGRS